jgi:hypothetical protein
MPTNTSNKKAQKRQKQNFQLLNDYQLMFIIGEITQFSA